MLSVFRQGGMTQTLIGAVVSLIIVVFVVEFRAASGQGGGKVAVECAVKVGTRCIGEKEFFAAQRLAAWDGMEVRQMKELDFERRVAEGLVERSLLVGEAERVGLGIGDSELEDELEAGRVRVSLAARDLDDLAQRLGLCNLVPNPLVADPERARRLAVCDPAGPRGVRTIEVKSGKTGRFDYKIYERTIRIRANRSPREFRETQREELIAERMREVIRTEVRVSEAETWLAFERARSSAVIDEARIERDWFARYVVESPDSAVLDWAAANQAEVDEAWKEEKARFVAGCSVVSEIVTRFSATTTDEDKVVLRGRIDTAKKALDGGADFAKVARETSDGLAAPNGGEIGCLDATAYGDGGEALVAAVKDLPVGSTTPVLETGVGFHILRVEARPNEATLDATGRKVVARRRYVRFKAAGLAKQFADEVIARVKGGQPLEGAVLELARAALAQPDAQNGAQKASTPTGFDAASRPRVRRSAAFARLGRPIPDAIGDGNVAAQAFGLEKPGTLYPNPVPTGAGYSVMVLVEKKLADRAEFDRDRVSLMRERQRLKADEALTEYIAALRKAAEGQIVINEKLIAPKKEDGEAEE
ncbi:MAG: SurA N-terminal domain-containing protein [Polyangiaceae bacterium]|nr:SurA N-terminal domain-containing protein [Polyangiaceae bacterium]